MEINEEESKAIKHFERLAKIWPKSLWIYSGSGLLCIMKKTDENNSRAMNEFGGVCQDHVVATIRIENDGGDWSG